MGVNPPLGHEALLTLARKAEAAARDGDNDRLEASVLRLLETLGDHVDAERSALLDLSPAQTQLLLRGQQNITGLLIDLAVAAQAPGPCRCDDIAQRLLAELTLQAEGERAIRGASTC